MSSLLRLVSSKPPAISSLARSTTSRRFAARTSSMLVTSTEAWQGPMRSIVSSAAARIAVSTLSRLDATVTSPNDWPFSDSTATSIRPTREDSWRSRRSSSSPRSPSVWPNTAPTTSLRSTTPSAAMVAWMRYFSVSFMMGEW